MTKPAGAFPKSGELESVAALQVITLDRTIKYQLILQLYHIDIYRKATGLIVNRFAWAEIKSINFDGNQIRFRLHVPKKRQVSFLFSCDEDCRYCECWLVREAIVQRENASIVKRVTCSKVRKYRPILE